MNNLNHVWDATIVVTKADEPAQVHQGFAARTLHAASNKVNRWLEEKKIEGEVISLVKTENVVI